MNKTEIKNKVLLHSLLIGSKEGKERFYSKDEVLSIIEDCLVMEKKLENKTKASSKESSTKVFYILYKDNNVFKLANFKTLEEAQNVAKIWNENNKESLVIETIKQTPKSVILGFYNKKKEVN